MHDYYIPPQFNFTGNQHIKSQGRKTLEGWPTCDFDGFRNRLRTVCFGLHTEKHLKEHNSKRQLLQFNCSKK
jgi:hypothetical protein